MVFKVVHAITNFILSLNYAGQICQGPKFMGTEFRNRKAFAHMQFGNKTCTHPACESVVAELAKVDDYSQDQQRHESQNTNSNTQSSMETVPCDLIDGEFSGEDEEAEETQLWARLMPLGPGFVTVGRHHFIQAYLHLE